MTNHAPKVAENSYTPRARRTDPTEFSCERTSHSNTHARPTAPRQAMATDDTVGDHATTPDSGDSGRSPSNSTSRFFVYELRGTAPLDLAQRQALSEFAISDRAGTGTADRATRALELLGEGVGIVEPSGEIVWMNHGLSRQTPELMRRFADACVEAIAAWRRTRGVKGTVRSTFRAEGRWYDVVMTPILAAAGAQIDGAVALLVDATATRRIQDRLDAIDQAGAALLRFDESELNAENAAERLRTLEARVLGATRSVLGFDNFEYRITNRKTEQLELVFCSGLVPLGIGERIFARPEANGLSGLVASTGTSIVCVDVAQEPRYVRGLPGASSTLTVPLRLYDEVVGVLNVESTEHAHFDDEDRIGAELLGRYVALALHMLDLLVQERCETLRATSTTLAREAETPLNELTQAARELEAHASDDATRAFSKRLSENIARVEELLKNAGTAQRGILGAEEFMRAFSREGLVDPLFAGRRVLVADDDDATRETVRDVFIQQGCRVTACIDGRAAIDAVRAHAASATPFDLVISDIRMPDANGYEVFRASKDASPETPVILMTGFGYDPNHSIVRSGQEGLHCHLFKPIEIAQLLEESRKALAARA